MPKGDMTLSSTGDSDLEGGDQDEEKKKKQKKKKKKKKKKAKCEGQENDIDAFLAVEGNPELFDEAVLAISKKQTTVGFAQAVSSSVQSTYVNKRNGTLMRDSFLALERGAVTPEVVKSYAMGELRALAKAAVGVDTSSSKQQAYCRVTDTAMPPNLATWSKSHLGVRASAACEGSAAGGLAVAARGARGGGEGSKSDRKAIHEAEAISSEMKKGNKKLGELADAIVALTPNTLPAGKVDFVAMGEEMGSIQGMLATGCITDKQAKK